MSVIDVNHEIADSALPVDPETGVYRLSIWFNGDAGNCHGDYTVGPEFEALYERYTDNGDGPPIVERWDESFYAECLHGDPTDLTLTQCTHYVRGTPEQIESQYYAAEEYEYDYASPFAFDGNDMDHVIAELRRLAFMDLRWCYRP